MDEVKKNWYITLYDTFYHVVDNFDVYDKTEKECEEFVRIKVSNMQDIEDFKMEVVNVSSD